MRTAFCLAVTRIASSPKCVFLTGDLGFQAFEPLAAAFGRRFINAGVAEQNMISVAAGLARSGLRPWVYSIAPFVYARPCEQVRNDICFHKLPVVLVGNGGGFGYGVMGPTHHALEDYGTLLGFPHLRAFIPAFDPDIEPLVKRLHETDVPAYLRLGRTECPGDCSPPPFAQWRKLLDGEGPVAIVVGPLAGGILAEARGLPPRAQPRLWLLSELPADTLPDELLEDVRASQHVCCVEEHTAWGGAARMVAELLLAHGVAPRRFTVRTAAHAGPERFGSQAFQRRECGLDPASIVSDLMQQGV